MRFSLVKETSRTAFATRGSANELRVALSTRVASTEAGETVEIDLSDVEAMTISFADELIAKIVMERRMDSRGDTFLLLADASPEVLETIEVALERRNLFVAHKAANGELILCAASPHLRESFEAANDLKEFTASQLAERLGIKLPAANNRIKQLAEAGVLIRRKHAPPHGGREYLYTAA